MILIPLLYRAVNYPEQCRRHDKELQTFYSKIPSTDQNMTICENFVKSIKNRIICLTQYFFSAIMRTSERSVHGESWPFMDGSILSNKNDRNRQGGTET